MSLTLQAFDLYLHGDRQGPHFEPLVCFDEHDVVPAVRRIIEERNLYAVEVHRMGVPLFTVLH